MPPPRLRHYIGPHASIWNSDRPRQIFQMTEASGTAVAGTETRNQDCASDLLIQLALGDSVA